MAPYSTVFAARGARAVPEATVFTEKRPILRRFTVAVSGPSVSPDPSVFTEKHPILRRFTVGPAGTPAQLCLPVAERESVKVAGHHNLWGIVHVYGRLWWPIFTRAGASPAPRAAPPNTVNRPDHTVFYGRRITVAPALTSPMGEVETRLPRRVRVRGYAAWFPNPSPSHPPSPRLRRTGPSLSRRERDSRRGACAEEGQLGRGERRRAGEPAPVGLPRAADLASP
jgi:hypothetical protein